MTHKKAKNRKVLDGEFDCIFDHSFWKHTVSSQDFVSAEEYLSLVMPSPDAKAYRKILWQHRFTLEHYHARDILRAANTSLCPVDDPEVYRYCDDIQDKEELSPVILVRGNYQRPLYIAHGYYKICASYHTDVAAMIPAVIV